MQRISKTFIDKGFQLTFFSRALPNNSLNIDNIHNKTISTLFRSSWLFYAEYNLKLFLYNIFKKSDYIYCVDADTLLAGGLLNFFKRNKLIYDAHEYFEHSPEITKKKFVQSVWNKITQFGINRAFICITVCESLAEIFQKEFGKKFEVILNVPETNKLTSIPIDERKNIIWYQGVLNIGRGLEEMIHCMTELPEYELHLAGDGDIKDKLIQLTQSLKLESRIKFLGKLSKEELQLRNRIAKIGINLLSDNSLNYYYSLANRTFDYIHAELPSIHMNFPEYARLLNQYSVGIKINSLSRSEIINAVRHLETENYKIAIEACKKAKEEYCWEKQNYFAAFA